MPRACFERSIEAEPFPSIKGPVSARVRPCATGCLAVQSRVRRCLARRPADIFSTPVEPRTIMAARSVLRSPDRFFQHAQPIN
jgi:hypothetical protein